ncbi:hypothetical protein ACI2LC_09180 [Nonomuraea wenchangensis]|uniref:hypothetical protein n=1 Tax=Nonomuraea wenchangensis TaxID=568860 RepID=UPI00384DDF34
MHDCDREPHQWWELRVGGNWTQDPPVPGTGHQLVSFADGSYEAAYFTEGKNSGNKPGTPAVAGDPDGTTASTVIWNVSYWRAGWWTTATDEPGKSAAWKRLGPAMPREYDQAVELLRDLHAPALRDEHAHTFTQRLTHLRERHQGKPSLIKRLNDAGLTAE